ncbi:DapH/DapD/GlmU-related protein [Vibrio splendidus]
MVRLVYFFYKNIMSIFNFITNFFVLKVNKVKHHKIPFIDGVIFIRNRGSIEIYDGVRINSCYRSNPIGGNCFMSIVTDVNGKVIIKENVGLSNTAIYSKVKIEIGSNTMIGGDCKIYDNDFHSLDIHERLHGLDSPNCSEVIIEENVFVGGGTIILKGVTIGKNAVVGAGSVVTKSIPSGQIWAGNPAKYIRDVG